MSIPSVQLLADAVYAVLDGHATLTVFDSIVNPAPAIDEAGVVKGYAVLHPGAGDATPNNLAAQPGQLLWQFQVTCAGGNRTYATWVVDTVRGLLDGKTLTVAGTKVGLMRPPFGFNPPTLTDTDVQPPRVWVPLQYQLLAVA